MAIEKKDWARVWAKAMLDSRKDNHDFRKTLQSDPLLASEQFRTQFPNFPVANRLINGLHQYEKDTGHDFTNMSDDDLQKVINGDLKKPIQPNKLQKKL